MSPLDGRRILGPRKEGGEITATCRCLDERHYSVLGGKNRKRKGSGSPARGKQMRKMKLRHGKKRAVEPFLRKERNVLFARKCKEERERRLLLYPKKGDYGAQGLREVARTDKCRRLGKRSMSRGVSQPRMQVGEIIRGKGEESLKDRMISQQIWESHFVLYNLQKKIIQATQNTNKVWENRDKKKKTPE